MNAFKKLKASLLSLKRELVVLYLAFQDKRTPWYAKVIIFLTVSYALSPIDLIPDFVPVLGYLDDLILLPLTIYLVKFLIPADVLEDCRKKAETYTWKKKSSWIGMGMIIFIWLLLLYLLIRFFLTCALRRRVNFTIQGGMQSDIYQYRAVCLSICIVE